MLCLSICRNFLLALALFCALGAAPAFAQVGANGQVMNPMGFGQAMPGMLPGQMNALNGGLMNGMGMSPQMQQLMMLRGLQGYGHHHGVHTGVPQPFIGFGPQFGPSMNWNNSNNVPAANKSVSGGRPSSTEKRAAARQAREEQKQLAREAAAAKKAKAAAARKIKAPKDA